MISNRSGSFRFGFTPVISMILARLKKKISNQPIYSKFQTSNFWVFLALVKEGGGGGGGVKEEIQRIGGTTCTYEVLEWQETDSSAATVLIVSMGVITFLFDFLYREADVRGLWEGDVHSDHYISLYDVLLIVNRYFRYIRQATHSHTHKSLIDIKIDYNRNNVGERRYLFKKARNHTVIIAKLCPLFHL